jgi:hypothetical protein
MEGLAEFCLFKVQTLQCVLGDLSRTYFFSVMLQQHIGSHRQQHRKLDKHLVKMGSKMVASIDQLLSWVAQLRQYQQHLRTEDPAVLAAYQATGVSSTIGEYAMVLSQRDAESVYEGGSVRCGLSGVVLGVVGEVVGLVLVGTLHC